MFKTICVYCSSSSELSESYFQTAALLGKTIGQRGSWLVYGGAKVGLMGEVAFAVKAAGGKISGIIPEAILKMGVGFDGADEFLVTETMHERKAKMEEKADAFVVMPGGFGTLEEAFEIITLKQLGYHDKPIVFINTNQYYEPLKKLLEHLFSEGFAKQSYRALYYFAETVDEAFMYLDRYQPSVNKGKF